MAAARTRTRKAQDTRALNFQPNNMPEHIVVVVSTDGEEIGPIAIPQNAKLSDKGNVTFNGGIKGGWVLEGSPNAALASLSFVIGGVELKASSDGVHLSSNDNPTIFFGGTIQIKAFDAAEPRRFTVQVWATYSVKHESYSLSVKAFPAPSATGRPRGPQVVGQVSPGFVLAPQVKPAPAV